MYLIRTNFLFWVHGLGNFELDMPTLIILIYWQNIEYMQLYLINKHLNQNSVRIRYKIFIINFNLNIHFYQKTHYDWKPVHLDLNSSILKKVSFSYFLRSLKSYVMYDRIELTYKLHFRLSFLTRNSPLLYKSP